MFQGWGFLLAEIWVLLAIAGGLGLLAGWLIWGARPEPERDFEAERLRRDLLASRARVEDLEAKLSIKWAPDQAPPPAVSSATETSEAQVEMVTHAPQEAEIEEAPQAVEAAPLEETLQDVGVRPDGLDGPRFGQADDLTQINGVGPKLEALCHSLGYYHFDQIAAWTEDEVAWVDANLVGFKGRVTRDGWVAQAQILASGGLDTEFD